MDYEQSLSWHISKIISQKSKNDEPIARSSLSAQDCKAEMDLIQTGEDINWIHVIHDRICW